MLFEFGRGGIQGGRKSLVRSTASTLSRREPSLFTLLSTVQAQGSNERTATLVYPSLLARMR